MATKKISEFLSASIGPWDICEATGLAANFEAETGEKPCWPAHTKADTLQAMDERGLGGSLKAEDDTMMAWGWEVAEALATKHVPGYRRTMIGRGSAFREAQEALENAGK